MLVMTIAFWAYAFAVIFMRVRNIILQRERHTKWLQNLTGDSV
jgi:heme exporter protein C